MVFRVQQMRARVCAISFTNEAASGVPEALGSGETVRAEAALARQDLDDRAALVMRRLNIWKDELVAWFKTLASAAVYATLIVTFGFQVARVEVARRR